MWYGYIPSSHISTSICSFSRDFCGFTDSRFTYRKFKEFVEQCGCRNLLEEAVGTCEFETEMQCVYAMNFVLGDNHMLFASRHKLECRTSQSINEGTTAIVSEVMYENFIACLGMNQEIRKIAADLYKLCSRHSVDKLYKYFGANMKDKDLIYQVIGKLAEYYDMIGPTLMNRGEYALVDRSCTKPALMWEVFDEPSEINEYLEKVYKIGFDLTDPVIQGSMNGIFA